MIHLNQFDPAKYDEVIDFDGPLKLVRLKNKYGLIHSVKKVIFWEFFMMK